VGETLLTAKLMHLKPEKAKMLEKLARQSDRKQSELMREAIDDLLAKYSNVSVKRKP
jgi:hypothetical protein